MADRLGRDDLPHCNHGRQGELLEGRAGEDGLGEAAATEREVEHVEAVAQGVALPPARRRGHRPPSRLSSPGGKRAAAPRAVAEEQQRAPRAPEWPGTLASDKATQGVASAFRSGLASVFSEWAWLATK